MANVVIIGIAGETGLWVADLNAGTVTKSPEPSAGALQTANDLRNKGATVTKGVNLAVLATSAEAVSGGYMDG
ncbi:MULTISPECIES: hypothetical protein [Pararhizobium]|jgi:hypothetical protein|uniref:hypothetical protein n=1 Tax=Pararhizobium TaxID=1612611 RepID=UPI0023E12692|nr:hypothetical protein [Pararhizobium qamdonense]